MRGICSFLLAFSLTVAAGFAWSADYDVRPVRIDAATRSGSTITARTVYSAKAMVPAAPVVYQARTVVTTAATAGKLLRFAASPAGLVTVTAVRQFFNWYDDFTSNSFDPVTGEPISSGSSGELPAGSVRYDACGLTVYSAGEAVSRCYSVTCGPNYSALVSVEPVNNQLRVYGRYQGSVYHCATVTIISGTTISNTLPWWDYEQSGSPPVSWLPYLSADDMGGPQPVTADDFWNDLLGSPYGDNSDVFRDLLDDANGVPWNTPEVQAGAEDIRRELASQDGTDPNTLPAPVSGPGTSADPSNPDAPFTSPDAWSSAPSGGASSEVTVKELPVFCTWASIVCEWLGWTQEPMADDLLPPLPVESIQAGTWDSGLSSGSCPPPVSISALGASVPISWQPACDFVGMLRPILIAFAGIAAALILLGQRAGGAG